MDSERLSEIVTRRRGITYLIKRLLDIDRAQTHSTAKGAINEIWKNSSLSDKELYDKLAKMLSVDNVFISKEQFMRMLEKAIDNAEDYFMDPLESVHMLTTNMLKMGGLKNIARKLEIFTNKL